MNIAEISDSMIKAQNELRGRGILKLPTGICAEGAKLYPMTIPVALSAKVTVGFGKNKAVMD